MWVGVLLLGFQCAWSQTEVLEPSDAPIDTPTVDLVVGPTDSTQPAAMTENVLPDTSSVSTDSTKIKTSTVDATPSPVLVGDNGFTIEVDKSLGKNADKQLVWALLATAVLPGSGEVYLREPKQGRGFLLAEVGFWGVFFMSLWSQDAYLQSARNQASEYAGIDASHKGVGFLNTMSEYRSYLEKEHRNDSYELAQILSGKRHGNYDIPANSENFWDFGSSNTPENTQHWKSFQSSLRYYRASKVVFTFAVGGLALNRVVALAHTLRLYRRTANQGVSWQAFPILDADRAGGQLAVTF
jgi:hypothetical protein